MDPVFYYICIYILINNNIQMITLGSTFLILEVRVSVIVSLSYTELLFCKSYYFCLYLPLVFSNEMVKC